MNNRGLWVAMAVVLALFCSGAVWLSQAYLPTVSAPLDAETSGRGAVVSADGARYYATPAGIVMRAALGEDPQEWARLGPGPVRLAAAGGRVFAAWESAQGDAFLQRLETSDATPEPLDVVATALGSTSAAGDGALWIGGIDGSVWREDGDGFVALEQRLPSWVRFLRYDAARDVMVAISADGSRLEAGRSGVRVSIAETPNVFTLHAALKADPEPDPDPYAPETEFRDCPECPEMVVVPGGTFLMGSPESEPGRDADEGPRRQVTIARFAIGKYEVTFAEYEACVVAGGCKELPDDRGWGRGQRPVINVSWNDAQAYVAWLNRKVGAEVYRLPSEAEWEYAARAGTTTRFSFGDSDGALGGYAWYSGNAGGKTHPVGAYPANAFGLADMHGNVWEWVQDCGNSSYAGAPSTGEAWMSGDCSRAVLRGGSWFSEAQNLRSAFRFRLRRVDRDNDIGFRLAQTLPGA